MWIWATALAGPPEPAPPAPAAPAPAAPAPAAPAPAAPAPAAPATDPAPAPVDPATAPPPAPPPGPTNVLLVLLDDVGTDKVSSYGEHPKAPKTPVIDQLARQGVRFRNAYSYSLCSPTRAALMTGRYTRRYGIGVIIPWGGTWELPLDEVLLPELLDRGGTDWATAEIGKWHLSGPNTPNAYHHANRQGFDHVSGSINNLYFEADEARGRGDTNYFHWEKDVDGLVHQERGYATKVTTDDALAWVATAHEPWFLYLPYNAAHAPFHSPPGSGVSPDAPPAQRYAAMVQDVDRELGRLLDGLPAGQRARTLVLVLGDNGTPHGVIQPPREPSHGKGTLFEGGTNVPLVVSGPGVAAGLTSDALVHVVDVLPTIAEWVGVDPALTNRPLDGISFADVLRGGAGHRQFLYTERFSPLGPPRWSMDQRAVRDDRYKLVVGPDGDWFYDLLGRDDDGPARRPEELSGEERARYEALKAELERLARDVRFEY